jgi:hypothetical protein
MTVQGDYTFTYDGVEITMPKIMDLPTGVVRKSNQIDDDLEKTFYILEHSLSKKQMAAIDKMPISELTKHLEKWSEGVGLGEASGSES